MAKGTDWQRDSREYRVMLQELAKQPVDSLTLPELREVEHHENPQVAARASDEIQKRVRPKYQIHPIDQDGLIGGTR